MLYIETVLGQFSVFVLLKLTDALDFFTPSLLRSPVRTTWRPSPSRSWWRDTPTLSPEWMRWLQKISTHGYTLFSLIEVLAAHPVPKQSSQAVKPIFWRSRFRSMRATRVLCPLLRSYPCNKIIQCPLILVVLCSFILYERVVFYFHPGGVPRKYDKAGSH